ncbi:dihydrolipoamide acetyltransferase family protein [Nonomuraea jiangxiensis]|uniref:Dihydrolipoamide acetyltransferase component of pyruvate dehydrogenase complex n=1 Tax=Nonomuraea jiangxiensis TaxID=633440 RepID=A0A1G7Z7P3_9ACTN|nr:dihydrolipoamide acetyltransferase family protein [Nonomuraea jiangxiensis]SDH04761.1 pyruvate dehydrogenase E2 component (dihydrolipoamide acetyltransferase) [Nonomuraea jiangxiensis]
MSRLLRMPEVAANATEAVLQGWAVGVGTSFAAGDVIATIETDKAVVDVAAETDGVLLRTLATEGATVAVGTAIAVLGDPGDQSADPADPADAADPAGAGDAGDASDRPARLFSSPLARRLAREAGVPIEDITGTGPNGRIIRRDVEAAIEQRTALTRPDTPTTDSGAPAAPAAPAPAAPAPAAPAPAAPAPGPTPAPAAISALDTTPAPAVAARPEPEAGVVGEVPHSRMRRAIATRLTESKQTTPHFYVRGTAHVGKLLKLRHRLNTDPRRRVSLNDLVVKAVAHAHQRVPEMNVIWTPEATRTFGTVDLSVAVATERGLVTPVLRSVEHQSITSIAAATCDLAERARAGRLRQDELEGGVLTVTNLGMYGVEEFAAIINPPQSAILAVGAVRQEPVVERGGTKGRGKIKVADVMRVTLSVDHRPIDGTVAAAWMRELLELLADPVHILA